MEWEAILGNAFDLIGVDMAYKSDKAETWGDLVAARAESEENKPFWSKIYREKGATHNIARSVPIPDMSIKEDLSLIDHALFVLSKRKTGDDTPLVYEFDGGSITVVGTSLHGIATIFDYDIVLYMCSHLAREMEKVKKIANDKSKGINNPKLPPRYIDIDTDDFLRFAQKTPGGARYEAMRDSLSRLKTTTVCIKQESGGYRRSGMFSYVGEYTIVEESNTKVRKSGKGRGVVKARVVIPNWIYDGIVRCEKPSVLTLHREYFSISSSVMRVLYRYAKRYGGLTGPIDVPVDEFHRISGSGNSLKEFTKQLKKILAKQPDLEEYAFSYISKGRGDNWISIKPKKRIGTSGPGGLPPVLTVEMREAAVSAAPDLDPDYLFEEWVNYSTRKGEEVRSPMRAFENFCLRKQQRKTGR